MHLSQQAFAENLLHDHGLDSDTTIYKPTPFPSGIPIDSLLPDSKIKFDKKNSKTNFNQSLVLSYAWHRVQDQIFRQLHQYSHNINQIQTQNTLQPQNMFSDTSKVPSTLEFHFTVTVTSIYSPSSIFPYPN